MTDLASIDQGEPIFCHSRGFGGGLHECGKCGSVSDVWPVRGAGEDIEWRCSTCMQPIGGLKIDVGDPDIYAEQFRELLSQDIMRAKKLFSKHITRSKENEMNSVKSEAEKVLKVEIATAESAGNLNYLAKLFGPASALLDILEHAGWDVDPLEEKRNLWQAVVEATSK